MTVLKLSIAVVAFILIFSLGAASNFASRTDIIQNWQTQSKCIEPQYQDEFVRCEFFFKVAKEHASLEQRQDYVAMLRLLEENNIAAYRTQIVLSWIITAVLLMFVVVALFLTYKQFERDALNNGSSTSLKVSKNGLEISSSVIGLFVIIAALTIFYLYVKEVYEIHPTTELMPSQSVSVSKKSSD